MNNLFLLPAENPTAFVALAGLIGIIIGSFLNVVIYRLPKMMELAWQRELQAAQGKKAKQAASYNLITPKSACPACNHTIRFFENIPILSFTLLKGHCSKCDTRISLRYPLVEILSGVLTAYIAWQFGCSLHALGAAIFALSLLTLTFIDLESQLLPDNITLPLIWLGLLFNLNHEFTSLASAVTGAVLGYLVLWAVYWVFKLSTGKEGMGYGDFKMLAAIGAWLGWQALPLIILISSLTASMVGISLIIFKKQDCASAIPFGPYLALAGIVVLFKINALSQLAGI